MKKEDIERILKESDELLGNFSDAQQRSHLTIYTNRSKESASKGGKIGGPKGGKTSKDNKLGFHSMSKEDRVKLSKEIGNRVGPRSQKEGFGIFGLSDDEKHKIAVYGGQQAVKSPNHVNNRKLTCPHCGKEGGYQIMKRWHMDNCKNKNI